MSILYQWGVTQVGPYRLVIEDYEMMEKIIIIYFLGYSVGLTFAVFAMFFWIIRFFNAWWFSEV